MTSPAIASLLITADSEVDRELKALGLTRAIVRDIAISAASARAESLSVDPYGAPGQLSYIHGIRAKRLALLPRGWIESRFGNVESTVNHELGIQLCFQNVDRACSVIEPQAISGKGPASRQLVNAGQGQLFDTPPITNTYPLGKLPTVWLICVSTSDDSVCVEVSCPNSFKGNQFDGFSKRIFVATESLSPNAKNRMESEEEIVEFDVVISKK